MNFFKSNGLRFILKLLFAILFIIAGSLHFLKTGLFLKIIPSYLPYPKVLVYVSGIFEMGLGMLLFIPSLSRLAGLGLILLLVAVFPANLHMALHPELFPELPSWTYWLRLPLQCVLILGVYWCSNRNSHDVIKRK